jgi:hypothetical protein
MAIKLTRKQRDAIREEIISDLSELGNFAQIFTKPDYQEAERYRARFEDGLALLDDLCWEPDTIFPTFEFRRLNPDRLARALRWLQQRATATLTAHVLKTSADQALAERAAIANDVYATVLAELAAQDPRKL